MSHTPRRVVAGFSALLVLSGAVLIAPSLAQAQESETRYYFHSPTSVNTIDRALLGDASFDTDFPIFDSDAYATDVPGFADIGAEGIADPNWSGELSGHVSTLSVDLWQKAPVGEVFTAAVDYNVIVFNGSQAIELPTFTAPVEAITPDPVRIQHTFTTMLTPDDDVSDGAGTEVPLSIDPTGPVNVNIRGTFIDSEAAATIVYDSIQHPSGFTTSSDGTTPTPTPTPTPTETAPPPPPPGGDRGAYPLQPNDPYFGAPDAGLFDPQQWGPKKIQAPQAWQEAQATGFGVNVAVIDSGLDIGHPDFDCGGKVNVVPGADAVNDGNGAADVEGHGTHVAGIIGACTNNGVGTVGVAPDATLMPIQVLSSDPNYDGDGDDNGKDDLAEAIRLAADSGAHVINMSLGLGLGILPIGGGAAGYIPGIAPEIDEAIEYAESQGVVVVAAAGNDIAFPLCEYPAIAEDVICVGATDPRDVRTWYSTFPNKLDNEDDIGPSVVAPGGTETVFLCDHYSENVLSTFARNLDTNSCDGLELGYETINGTSMATPHVSGLAALLYDRLGGIRSAANAEAIKDAIVDTAADLGTPGYDPVFGYGRIDALAAVTSIEPVTTGPTATTLSFTSGSAQAGQYSDSATFEALLTDESGTPIPAAEVSFSLVGAEGTDTWTAITGPDGVASRSVLLSGTPGARELIVAYDGQGDAYSPSSNLTGFSLQQDDSTTSLTVLGKGAKRDLTALVVDADSSAPLQGILVDFYADGDLIGTAVTDAGGSASVDPRGKYQSGKHNYEARSAGNDYYRPSSALRRT